MVQSLEVAAQLHVSPQTDTLKQQGLYLSSTSQPGKIGP